MRQKISIVIVFMLMGFLLGACQGESGLPRAKEGTLLRKIQDRGKLIVGVRYELPTFGYLNPQTKQVEGFEPAIAREVAAYIFGDSTKLEFKEAITQNRIPYLKDGTVDIIMSNFVYSEERLREVDGSVVYFVGGGALMVPKGSSIKSLADLDTGKKVAAAKGSIYIDQLKKLTNSKVVLFDTYTEAAQALLNNQVDAIGNSDTILDALKVTYPTLDIVGGRFSTEYVGAAVAKGNPELLDVVNTVIKNIKSSGRWRAIWKTEIGDKVGILTIPEPPADEWQK